LNLEDFLKGIKKFETEFWFGDIIYFAALDELQPMREGIEGLKGEEVTHLLTQVVKLYLVQWGQMARTVNQDHIKWDELANRLLGNESLLIEDPHQALLGVDLHNSGVQKSIVALYGTLDKKWFHRQVIKNGPHKGQIREVCSGIGPTSVSKVLHLLNPNLFVMWDDQIRGKLHDGYDGDGKEYVRFLQDAQIELKNCLDAAGLRTDTNEGDLVGDLCRRMKLDGKVLTLCEKKTLAKLLDEYYWTIVPRAT
jgi:hypothetical protein